MHTHTHQAGSRLKKTLMATLLLAGAAFVCARVVLLCPQFDYGKTATILGVSILSIAVVLVASRITNHNRPNAGRDHRTGWGQARFDE